MPEIFPFVAPGPSPLLVLLFPDHLDNPPLSFDGISLEVFIALSHSPFNLLSYKLYKIKFPISSPLPAVLLQLCVFVAAWFELSPVWGDSFQFVAAPSPVPEAGDLSPLTSSQLQPPAPVGDEQGTAPVRNFKLKCFF